MILIPHSATVPLLILLASRALHVEAAVPVTISTYDGYLDQRDCVKLCLWHTAALDDLIADIGCSPPWVNECFCNTVQASSASDFLSSCVASRCSTPRTDPAVTSALSVYDKYCSDNGFDIPTVASLQSFPAYKSRLPCVQQCLWNSSHPASAKDLMPALGCGTPWDNACLCNATLASSAGAFLSTCVANRCSTGTDAPQVTAAASVYQAYCSAAGLPIPEAALAASTTSTSISQEAGAATGVVPTPSQTETTAVSEQSSAGLSSGAIAGIVVGCVLGVAALAAAATFVMYKKRRAGRADPAPPAISSSHELASPPAAPVYEKPTEPPAFETGWHGHVVKPYPSELPGSSHLSEMPG